MRSPVQFLAGQQSRSYATESKRIQGRKYLLAKCLRGSQFSQELLREESDVPQEVNACASSESSQRGSQRKAGERALWQASSTVTSPPAGSTNTFRMRRESKRSFPVHEPAVERPIAKRSDWSIVLRAISFCGSETRMADTYLSAVLDDGLDDGSRGVESEHPARMSES